KAGGFALNDVKVEAVGGSPTRARLLKERKIDMGLQPYPLSYEAEAQGFTNLGAMAKLVPDYQFVSVMVDDNWASKNRAALIAFLKAMRRGTDYMFAHPDESTELAAKELRTSPAFARRALEDTLSMDIMSRDLSLTDASPAAGVRHHAAGRRACARRTVRSGEIRQRELPRRKQEIASGRTGTTYRPRGDAS